MDINLGALFSWQFLLFSLGMFAITWIIRTIIEYLKPTIVGAKMWEKLALPLMPILFGAIIALIARQYPFPDGLAVSVVGRLLFGVVSGLFSGTLYQVIKGLLKDKIQSFMQNNTTNIQTTSDINDASTRGRPSV